MQQVSGKHRDMKDTPSVASVPRVRVLLPLPDKRLRPVIQPMPAPPMTESLRRFIDWVAAYTLSPPGAVLRMAMSVPAALEPPTQQAGWTLAGPGGNRTGNSQPR